ncbi:MAG: DNA mismatch repair endonuclease MutL [Oscillospiraceae bacterium]
MANINVLDKHLAELIAAGEVVERPAAVIKELTENSIDAGATKITIEIRDGGVTYMRVTDNGQGIENEQVAKAFLRHATSKIQTTDDLYSIGTMGFRGEALASIAAMCKVEMITRTEDNPEGTKYVIHGSQEIENSPQGCPVGTSITVRDIFYNTPARMKFLKKDTAEGSAITMIVEKLAIAHPEISFKLIRDGKTILMTSGDDKLLSVVHSIYGREISDTLLPVDYSYNGVTVTGYVSKPTSGKSKRTMQNFFINRRYVKTATASIALEEAYKHSIITGKFPVCFLNIDIALHDVDVNVHPAKTEVRFTNEKVIFEGVLYAVKSTLGKNSVTAEPENKPYNPYTADSKVVNPIQQRFSAQQYREMVEQPIKKQSTSPSKQMKLSQPFDMQGITDTTQSKSTIRIYEKPIPMPLKSILIEPTPQEQQETQQRREQKIASIQDDKPDRYQNAKFIGEVFSGYILLQTDTQLIFIDKHAAHERLNFNKLLQAIENGQRQLLLTPVVVNLPKDVYAVATDRLDEFLKLGMLVEDFGEGTLVVREIPQMLADKDIAEITEEIAVKMYQNRNDLTPEVVYDMLHSMACRAAIMAGEQSGLQELNTLIELLKQNEDVKYCPHGRPIEAVISKRELEKRFGRLG